MIVRPRTYGRMGNFLWQAACAISYALKHGLEFSVPNTTTSEKWNPLYLQHLVNPNWVEGWHSDIVVREQRFAYDEIPFDESWRGNQIVLDGYWQSWKYIDEYRDEIIGLFNFPYQLKDNVCGIHARFGDYLEIPNKHVLTNEHYLMSAISYITEKTGITRFKVFSDDIPYFKNNFGYIYDFEYSTNTNEVEDFVELSCCHSSINSSSTFSWWAAYINKNPSKVIVTPILFFREGWKENTQEVTTDDIIPKEWIKM